MATTISFGIQKGGVGKTSVCGITSWLLSREYKVLSVDFDSQGNLTQFLTQKDIYDFTKHTAFEACKEKDPRPYIYNIPGRENLYILPAEDFLSQFDRYVYDEYKPILLRTKEFNSNALSLLLKETLEVVNNDYDFICIDLPPNLGTQTINGIAASDYAVVMFQSEPWCRSALERYLETILAVRDKVSPNLEVAGILTSMIDTRTTLGNTLVEDVRETYGDLVFDTTIRRRARITEFSFDGISDSTKNDKEALVLYEDFLKELIERVC